MDIPEVKNKILNSEASVNKADAATRVTAATRLTQDYFFPGGGKWKPMTIRAADLQEAEEIHRRKRDPVSPAEAAEKVGESKETINE